MDKAYAALRPTVPEGWIDPQTLPAHLKSTLVDPATMEWEPSKFPGISAKVLFADPATGMSSILFKMEPGAIVPLHEHPALEQSYILEGSLEDLDGTAHAGQFIWRPAGNVHQAYAPNGAVLLGIFLKPNIFANGTAFYTKS